MFALSWSSSNIADAIGGCAGVVSAVLPSSCGTCGLEPGQVSVYVKLYVKQAREQSDEILLNPPIRPH